MTNSTVFAQLQVVEKKKFFTDDRLIGMTLVADFKKLMNDKLKKDLKDSYLPATLTCIFPDSTRLTEQVVIKSRGKYRKEECYVPPIVVDFKTVNAGALKKLGHMKLVWPCNTGDYFEQLVLKEFLIYKIFNLLTPKSFMVRLVKMRYEDLGGRLRSRNQFAFFIEDADDMAKRNDCEEFQSAWVNTEATERQQTTLVALFQYMIGNTDWAVPIYRNIKLIRSKKDASSKPLVVPYDFDYSGLVNASYAIPSAELRITNVRERLYRGYPRSMEELRAALKTIHDQKSAIDSLILNFPYLDARNRKEMKNYLDEFFKMTRSDTDIKIQFINRARDE